MTNTVGVDPGLKGAIGLIVQGYLVDLQDMPVIEVQGKRKKSFDRRGVPVVRQTVRRSIDEVRIASLFRDWLTAWGPIDLWLETVRARTGEGASRSFNFGDGNGRIRGCAAGVGLPVKTIEPSIWKPAMGCTAVKDTSRQVAIARFPGQAELFRRKLDDGRAEAALIGLYGHIHSNK